MEMQATSSLMSVCANTARGGGEWSLFCHDKNRAAKSFIITVYDKVWTGFLFMRLQLKTPNFHVKFALNLQSKACNAEGYGLNAMLTL